MNLPTLYKAAKRQAATRHFSKDFLKNPENVPNTKKKGIETEKRIVHAHFVLISFANLELFGFK
jgi:hypothetical protein